MDFLYSILHAKQHSVQIVFQSFRKKMWVL